MTGNMPFNSILLLNLHGSQVDPVLYFLLGWAGDYTCMPEAQAFPSEHRIAAALHSLMHTA